VSKKKLPGCTAVRSDSELLREYALNFANGRIELKAVSDQSFTETTFWPGGKVETRSGHWLWYENRVSFDQLWMSGERPSGVALDFPREQESKFASILTGRRWSWKEMKCRLLGLLALLVIPAVAAPDKVSTCDFKISVRDAETTEGRRIRDGNVRFVVPCVQRDDLAKALATFGVAEPRVREQAQRALGKAQEVTLILTSNMVKE
jgi:hypothetical protein